MRSALLDAIFMSHCRWNSSLKRRASARASSVACFASKPGNRLRKRSRTSGWRPPSWRWNKGGAPSKKSRRKLALATGSACAESSYALLGKRRRRFATRHTHSLRSDRPFPSLVPPSPRTSAYTILSVVALVLCSARKTAPFRLRLGRVGPADTGEVVAATEVRKGCDFVAKVFLRHGTQILRA